MEPELLKKIILDAQEIRENSWVYHNEEKTEGRYTLDMHESARLAIQQNNARPCWTWIVYLLNYHAWNDVQNWNVGD
jgi:hypothetical protein